jgi:uncharacterized phage protein gp47/JayE
LLRDRLPSWVPRNASLEIVYLEAVALAVSEVTRTANDVAAQTLETLLEKVFLIPRLSGVPAAGRVTLTFDTAVSLTVAAGTTFLVPGTGARLVTVRDVDVTTKTAILDVEAAAAGADLNGIVGVDVDLLDGLPNTLSATITTAMAGGVDSEDDAAYIARCGRVFSRMSSSLVTPDAFATFALESGQATNAVGVRAWDGRDPSAIGTMGGHVTVVAWGAGGPLPDLALLDLQTRMQDMAATGATVHVTRARLHPVDVAATVTVSAGADRDDVRARLLAVLAARLDPARWAFGAPVRSSVLLAAVQSVPGVDHVTGFSPAADITLAADQLASLGTTTGLTVA